MTTLSEVGSRILPTVQHGLEQAAIRRHLGKVPNPGQCEFMTNIQNGVAAIQRQVSPVLGTTRIHAAAEQLVGSIVNVVCPGVISAQQDTTRHAVIEVCRGAMVDAASQSRKCGYETEVRIDGWIEVLEIREP